MYSLWRSIECCTFRSWVGYIIVNESQTSQYCDIQGTSRGHGFQGAMKRHGFAGGQASHGNSKNHRTLGSTGQSTVSL